MDVDPEIVSYYADSWDEDARLRSGLNELEFVRTQEIIRRYLPEKSVQVLDAGGGSGIHAEWLLDGGHAVHLVDPVSRHIETALAHLGSRSGFAAEVGDARGLSCDKESFDVVLLLGPLYHLPDRKDRGLVWSEASRVLRPGGIVVGAAISRFASLFGGLSEGMIFDDEFREIVYRDLPTGIHTNPGRRPEWFTTSYFHRPEELVEEAARAGLDVDAVLGVEGLAAVLPQLETDWDDPTRRRIIVEAARAVESEPSLLGLGPHVLLVATKP